MRISVLLAELVDTVSAVSEPLVSMLEHWVVAQVSKRTLKRKSDDPPSRAPSA